MGTCGIHFFGSNTIMDALTEHRLGSDLAIRMDAISGVFAGMGHWQRSYVLDIEGHRSAAVEQYDLAQSRFSDAFSNFKGAELERAKLVSHFLSVNPDYVVRPAVKESFFSQSVGDLIEVMKSEGRLPQFVSVSNFDEFGPRVANLKGSVSGLPKSGDEMVDVVVNFFAVDLQKLREVKSVVKDIMDVLAGERHQVERGTLYESLGHSIHAKHKLYDLSVLTARVRVQLVEYITLVELYGGLITNSLMHAKDDDATKWSEVESLIVRP